MIYRTSFNLIAPVCDLEEAQRYLQENNISRYLKFSRLSEDTLDKIDNIEWILQTENSGYIELTTSAPLTEQELSIVSDWVAGQNSDGLGEGFEQQEFACYSDTDYADYESETTDRFVVASFDWKHNDYKFELIDG